MSHPSAIDTVRTKVLACLGAGLALAGVGAATASAGLSTAPVAIARLDGSTPAAHAQPARSMGQERMGGDLKRAIRVTRRKHRNGAEQRQTWAGVALIVPKQAIATTTLVA